MTGERIRLATSETLLARFSKLEDDMGGNYTLCEFDRACDEQDDIETEMAKRAGDE